MTDRDENIAPETSSDEDGNSGTTSGSEVSIEEEGDDNNRLLAGSDESGEEDSESSDDEGSFESDSSESDESSSGDSESTDSLWEAFDDGDRKQTQEASEASALIDFQRALDYIVEGKNAVAVKILKHLLNNPLVKGFSTTVFDWEAEVDERLSKMARLFVGIHKNLAKLEEGNSIHHFLQILSVAPKNAEIWLNLGVESIACGDVDFAKFAFQHSEGPEATDALLSTLYLSRNYHACLRQAQKCLSIGICHEKALFLKERIRSINCHYSEFCDNIFIENRRYDDVQTLDENVSKEIAKRLSIVEERLSSVPVQEDVSLPSPIEIIFDAEQSVLDVATCFCDLYDRIEAYSNLSLQQITFSRWEDRRDLVDSLAVLEEILAVVETVDCVVRKVCSQSAKIRDRCGNASSVYWGASDSFLRRSMRYAMEIPFEEDDSPYHSDNAIQSRVNPSLPMGKLAESLGLHPKCVTPLKSDLITKSLRTPSPDICREYFDTDMLLFLLMTTLKEGRWTIYELLESFLCLIADISPAFGAIPSYLQDIVVQCYRRFNRLSSNLCDKKYIRLHVLMDELGEPHARDYCIRWNYTESWTDRELLLRFILNHTKAITDENIRLSFLRCLYNSISDDEFIFTATGWTGKHEIRAFIDRLERSRRIVSISQLRSCCRYEEIISIITRDVDFNVLDGDDLFEMVGYLMEAYYKTKRYDEAMNFISRVFLFLLSLKPPNAIQISSLLHGISEVDWCQVTKENCEKVGYFLCQLTDIDDFASDWLLWKELYRIVQRNGGGASEDYILSLDAIKQYESMPGLALDVLVKAHEKLGKAKKCGNNKGEFLLFFMEELHVCVSNEQIMKLLQKDDFLWLWSNVSEEISQCLHCMFGRYSKRRRALEDHECCINHNVLNDYSVMILELAMPHPLPKYDDKERFGHDVVNLLLNKFPSMLQYSADRKDIIHKFNIWMRNAAKDETTSRSRWPTVKHESYVQSCIWYLMALHHYRQSNHDEIETYSKLFLTSGYATLESRVTAGAWAVLAYTCVFRLFQMDDDLLYLEWPWHVIPFRISILVDNTVGVVFFQLANTLYQIATRLSRYFLTVPSDDWRLRHSLSILRNLRQESQSLFEEALSQAFHWDAGGICEYQWLCYFFLAKLEAKLDEDDVVKVVDGFYEAACSCELSEFFYPIKIGVKKQQNIEPVEIHYQIHAAVWKFLRRNQAAPLKTLVSLLAYLRAMQNHKVVRSNLSLFSSHPEIHEILIYMTINCSADVEGDIATCVDDILTRVDIAEELWNLCHRGFELTCERFPHMKSYYRLAEMELNQGNVEAAYAHLIKHVFRRKKRDDSLFDSVVEITSQDIDRSGSFPYHVERVLQLTMCLAYKLKDISALISIISTLVGNIERNSEEFILKERQGALLMHAVSRLHILAMESSSPKHLRSDMYRAWQAVSKCKSLAVRNMQVHLRALIQRIFGSVEHFVAEQLVIDDQKKKHVRKRKLTPYDLGTSHPDVEHHDRDPIFSSYHNDTTNTNLNSSKIMRLASHS